MRRVSSFESSRRGEVFKLAPIEVNREEGVGDTTLDKGNGVRMKAKEREDFDEEALFHLVKTFKRLTLTARNPFFPCSQMYVGVLGQCSCQKLSFLVQSCIGEVR